MVISPVSATVIAASAVLLAAWTSTSGKFSRMYRWHWAEATGIDSTVVMASSDAPGRARRQCSMSSTISR